MMHLSTSPGCQNHLFCATTNLTSCWWQHVPAQVTARSRAVDSTIPRRSSTPVLLTLRSVWLHYPSSDPPEFSSILNLHSIWPFLHKSCVVSLCWAPAAPSPVLLKQGWFFKIKKCASRRNRYYQKPQIFDDCLDNFHALQISAVL